ncbi:hypothetical protein COU80_01235 [Candidatus Peregrinibacteria bacterium CG10_big_fil_rev_8_21_14_0_10_55_24]|nr:MAG: hypothetical protein COU80_01235 [Candidatus Peregrinibacteria bacterium CG10_big_fil_rev_8_21_14_0_10_55_24]
MPAQLHHPTPQVSVRRSILTKAVWQQVIFATCIVCTLSVIAFLIARAALEQRVLAQLSSIVAAKEDLIEQVFRDDRERTALLASRSEMQQVLLGISSQATLQHVLVQLHEENIPAEGIAVWNRAGVLAASVGDPGEVPTVFVPRSTVIPQFTLRGWNGYLVLSPIRSSAGEWVGTIGVRYDESPLLAALRSVSSLGETGEVLLGREEDHVLALFVHRSPLGTVSPLLVGTVEEQYAFGSPIAQALHGEEGLRRAEDYQGHDVYVAYRSLSSVPWGLAVKVDRAEALQGTATLASFLAAAGVFLALAASVIAYILAQRLTAPVIHVSKKVSQLRPGHWGFRSTVRTGDEVEVLDRTAADLASRLKRTYEHLEDEVAARTEELREQYAKDRAILDSVEHGIIAVDRRGCITDINEAAMRMLSDTQEHLRGAQNTDVLQFLGKKNKKKYQVHPIRQALRARRAYRADTRDHLSIVRNDGTLLPINIVITPLISGRKLWGAVAVFQDMTEERRIDYIKSEFISLASHQLRTPLSSLQWYLELLTSEKHINLTSIQKESLSEMQRAVQRMANLVETLLHASRLEGGDITPKIQRVNVTQFLRDLAEELQSLAKERKLSFSGEMPSQSLALDTDPILLHVVFQNIFSNVLKYSKEGGNVNLRCSVNKQMITITVQDTGIGIPKEDQPRIFERLFRARNATKVDTDGSGLGLYISRMILETLGGKISFESEEGRGAQFTVVLPRRPRGTPKSPRGS